MAEDDRRSDPYHVSHTAWHAITVAVDHLHCLRNSLHREQSENRLTINIHTNGQASLIRGAIENGARAVWLIGPANRLVRISRRLATEANNMRHGYRLRDLLGAPHPRTQQERMQQLVDLLLNASPPSADGSATTPAERAAQARKALRFPQYVEIVREAGEMTPLGAKAAEVVWSSASSLAHGDFSGSIALLEKEIVSRQPPNVNLVKITGSVKYLYWITVGAVIMIDAAFQILERRANPQY